MIIVIVCGSVIGMMCLAGGFFFRSSGAHPASKLKKVGKPNLSARAPSGASYASELWGTSSKNLQDVSEVSGKKISLKALDSTRVQESNPGGEFLRAAFGLSSDMVHADGQTVFNSADQSEDSSEIAAERIEATLMGADMEEEEPDMQAVSYTSELLAGSVGRFGTGMKPKLPSFRPTAREADTSLVWNAPGPGGKKVPVSLTIDLVVQSPHGGEEVVLEEDEPDMNTPLTSPPVSIRAILQGKQGKTAHTKQAAEGAIVASVPDKGADELNVETENKSESTVRAPLAGGRASRSPARAEETAVEAAAHEYRQGDEVAALGLKDAAADDEEDSLLDKKAGATQRPEQDAGSKRSLFSSSLFSFSKKKAAYQGYTISVSSGSDAADAATSRDREGAENTDNLQAETKPRGSREAKGVPNLPLPSLADGMGLETEFEEAEPGKLSTSLLLARLSLQSTSCSCLHACILPCFFFQNNIHERCFRHGDAARRFRPCHR